MKQLIAFLIVCAAWMAQAAAPIGTNISRYLNTNVAPASSLLLLAVTNEVPATNYNIKISDFLAQATNTPVVTNWTLNIPSLTFLTNWANAISNYVTAATNSASVTNWINSAQPASVNLTNWSLIPTGAMANVVSVTYITNAINNISNYINSSVWTNNGLNIQQVPSATLGITGTVINVSVGQSNIALGALALKENVKSNNVAIGIGSMRFTVNGFGNTAIGNSTLTNVSVDGQQNVAAGLFSLEQNDAGSFNVAVGAESLRTNATGVENVAIGRRAMWQSKFQDLNVAIGSLAMQNFNNGFQNTVVGPNAGDLITTMFDVTAIGYGANDQQSSSTSDTAIGSTSMGLITSATSRNTAVGFESLKNAEDARNNVALGYEAGENAGQLTNVTLLGYQATAASGLSNATAVGSGASVRVNNQMSLGNGALTDVVTAGRIHGTNGLSAYANLYASSTGLLGGLVVTQDMRILGHNVASNYIWVATNATTGEGEWRDISALLSPVGINPRTNLLNIQYEPVRGSTWYSGTNGIPTTNEARAGLEFSPFWRSLRMGEVAAGGDVYGLVGNGSNYWNNTNIGPLTVGYGSNAFVKGAFSSVLGGAYNAILTNAKYSVIGGGYNNLIDTNAGSSVIAGGGRNSILSAGATLTEVNSSTISGGTNNSIHGTTIKNTTIGGGGDNDIDSAREATIAGGVGNQIELDGRSGFIGGGDNNRIGVGSVTEESQGSVIGGGSQNQVRGDYSVIGGGELNNLIARGDNHCVIAGGQLNVIGVATVSESTHASIGGGLSCLIENACDYSVISGGRSCTITGNSTNGFIGGGAFNTIQASSVFSTIPGGERNSVSGSYSFALGGASNSVTAARAGAIGMNVTNSTAGSVTVGELISYNTPAVIAGAGSGSTNYLLAVTSPKMLLGSSNVHIYGVSGTISGKTHNWSVNITNLSADTWGINFASGTNRWKFQSWMYGTNAPAVLTNNTLLRLNGESEGTNTLVTYEYFRPAL